MVNGDHHQRQFVQGEARAAPAHLGRLLARAKPWESSRPCELTLRETFNFCRQCHKLAPFCFYNGNTFLAIGRTLIQDLLRKMPPVKAYGVRSVVGHYITGTADVAELAKALDELD